ncbi:MAG: hypothetical protein ACRD22_15875, partial [Terriglobia bacterium]
MAQGLLAITLDAFGSCTDDVRKRRQLGDGTAGASGEKRPPEHYLRLWCGSATVSARPPASIASAV